VGKVARRLGLGWIQLHGRERPEQFADLARELRILRGFSAREPEAGQLEAWRALGAVPLVDGPRPGSGASFDWSQLDMSGDFYIAGGLDPSNVADAIRATGATGVDVASGVERDGIVEPQLVHDFVRNARAEGGVHP
jgi:phosphoribosylanthranilate isomerase